MVGRRWAKRLSAVMVYLGRPVVVHGNLVWFGGELHSVKQYVFSSKQVTFTKTGGLCWCDVMVSNFFCYLFPLHCVGLHCSPN